MTPIADAIAETREYLPRGAAHIAIPDTAPSGPGGKPGSRYPGNQQAANAVWDTIAAVTVVRAEFAHHVHGRYVQAYPYAATGAALDAIERLGEAVTPDMARWAVRELLSPVHRIKVLPAEDAEERPQLLPGIACPYCQVPMVMTLPRAGVVYCKRGGLACADSNGFPPRGQVMVGRLGPCVEWADGLVT